MSRRIALAITVIHRLVTCHGLSVAFGYDVSVILRGRDHFIATGRARAYGRDGEEKRRKKTDENKTGEGRDVWVLLKSLLCRWLLPSNFGQAWQQNSVQCCVVYCRLAYCFLQSARDVNNEISPSKPDGAAS